MKDCIYGVKRKITSHFWPIYIKILGDFFESRGPWSQCYSIREKEADLNLFMSPPLLKCPKRNQSLHSSFAEFRKYPTLLQKCKMTLLSGLFSSARFTQFELLLFHYKVSCFLPYANS